MNLIARQLECVYCRRVKQALGNASFNLITQKERVDFQHIGREQTLAAKLRNTQAIEIQD